MQHDEVRMHGSRYTVPPTLIHYSLLEHGAASTNCCKKYNASSTEHVHSFILSTWCQPSFSPGCSGVNRIDSSLISARARLLKLDKSNPPRSLHPAAGRPTALSNHPTVCDRRQQGSNMKNSSSGVCRASSTRACPPARGRRSGACTPGASSVVRKVYRRRTGNEDLWCANWRVQLVLAAGVTVH
ncbi:hypothetical protein B0H17DRAFT_1188650 [Mycena rosella]|uniref:Uncharacterized protein n=1 Tax=Mycena rosella TaxID=1033263 RepID=A0AAD7BF04_MYCRO|nr:hypothetical protein B0H17DRAFT_1188650 [Mycena rosella]